MVRVCHWNVERAGVSLEDHQIAWPIIDRGHRLNASYFGRLVGSGGIEN